MLSNLFGATFDSTFDGSAASGAATTPLFVNAGSFRKTGATAAPGTTSIDFQFINTGTVEVQTNTLRYAINQQTAGLTLLDGGGLTAQAQPIQLLGGSLMGTGLVTLANTQTLTDSATSYESSQQQGEAQVNGTLVNAARQMGSFRTLGPWRLYQYPSVRPERFVTNFKPWPSKRHTREWEVPCTVR